MTMEVVVTTGAISRAKLQSNHHHQQTNIQFFYRLDALPVAQPTASKHRREKYHIPRTCSPQTYLGIFQLCLWPLIAPGYFEGALPALWCQYQYIEDIFIQHLFVCLLASAHKTHWSDFCESFTRDMFWTRKLLLNFQNYWYLSLDLGILGRNFYTGGIGVMRWNFADNSRSCCFTTILLQLCGLDLILLLTTVSKLF